MELEIRDELGIVDMLYLFGHKSLGLTVQDALEIDPMYHYRLEYENR